MGSLALTLDPTGPAIAFGSTYVWESEESDCRDFHYGRAGALWAAGTSHVLRWAAPEWNQERFLFVGIQDDLNGITFQSVDGDPDLTLSGRRDGKVFFLDPRSGASQTLVPSDHALVSIARNRSGRLTAVGSEGGELYFITPAERTVMTQLPKAHADTVSALRFVGEELLISSSDNRTVKLWTSMGDLNLTLNMPGPVKEVEVLAEGYTLAVLLENERAARIWHLDRVRDRLADLGINLGF